MIKLPWSRSEADILKELGVFQDAGLTAEEIPLRYHQYGPNSLSLKKKLTSWYILYKQIMNPMVLVLFIAGGIAFILGEILDGWAILAIVFLNILIGFIQESKAEASIEALAALAAPKAKVLRDSKIEIIPSAEVVPGDILVLEAGDFVPADARIVTAYQLSAQEAVLTGESLPVEKNTELVDADAVLSERKNMLFGGTALSTGTSRAVITATGKNSEIGKIAEMMSSTETTSTPLQLRLEGVSQKLLWLGLCIVILIVGIGYFQGKPWIEILMAALSLSVAAIPEGLPTVVTIALVMAVHRMSRKRALVRKMDSVETLGATDVICTDKTGTLTTGSMQVREEYLLNETDRDLFFLNLILCNNASISNGAVGDTTEIALLEYAHEKGHEEDKIRSIYPRMFEWSFDSDRKRMSVAAKIQDKTLVLTKGAPEAVLPHCRLDENERTKILKEVSGFSQRGMRVLGLAYRKIESSLPLELKIEEVESDLNFLGLVAMADPPRPESRDAIKKCQDSGIRVIMITGDHPQTAAAIAFELGIIFHSDEKIMTGRELDTLSKEQIREVVKLVSVYARVSPEHKLKLISGLKSLGHIVAMTGDGVNDAPALKSASIGIAMGKGGTEVARQASSMVLTDDNFATIVDAIEEGRAVNGNIRRTLQYLLSTNLAELLFILIATALGWPVPLLPVNLLWLNLVSDGLPSLALAAESVPPQFLRHSTRPTEKSFFNRNFYQEMVLVGVVITIMSLVIYRYGLLNYDLSTGRTLAFSFLVYAVLFRSFSCRSEHLTFFEMKPNPFHLISVLLPICLQLLIQEIESFRLIFKIHDLPFATNLILIALGCVPVTIVELYKLWKRHPLVERNKR